MESSEIEAAVAALRRGELIGLPTETVYGLAGDAANPEAVRRIFGLKGRPADHPLIVHVAESRQMAHWARDVDARAQALAARFWPGPLTLILKRAPQVSDLVTGGQDTIGLRVPSHPTAQAVLRGFGGGLAAPSANRFGRVSPTTAQHVRNEFGAALPIVLDGGACEHGIESTIVDLSGDGARILRPGAIPLAAIDAVLQGVHMGAQAHSPRVSGALKAHYAPRAAIELVAHEALAGRWRALAQAGVSSRVLALGTVPEGAAGLALGEDARTYAHRLYAALRALDVLEAQRLLIETPPSTPEWLAVNDRLMRAAAGSPVEEET